MIADVSRLRKIPGGYMNWTLGNNELSERDGN